MIKKLLLIWSMLWIALVAHAANSPVDMLQTTSEQMITALKENQATIKSNPSYVYKLARQLLLPHVDVAAMSRLALGREAWNNATAAEQQQFTKEFTDLMIRTYGSALAAYSDEEVKFRPLRGDAANKSRVQVDSVIVQRGGPSIPVSYRLFLKGNQWKVYDISVDGVSMVQSFRSQFASELSRGGMSGLLQAMRGHRKQS